MLLTVASGTNVYQADCGSAEVMNRVLKLKKMLENEGKKPYVISHGGQGGAGIWVRIFFKC